MVGIGSVNNVLKATSIYGAASQAASQFRTDLTGAHNLISELREDQQETRSQLEGHGRDV